MLTTGLSRRTLLNRAALSAGAALAASAVAPCRGVARQGDLTPMSLQLNWNPNAEHAPYYLGQQLGYYAEEGIELEILPGTGSGNAVTLVGTGDSPFGVAIADALVLGRAQGVPALSTAVLLQENPGVLVSFKEKGIVEPEDIYGKRIALNPQSTGYAFWVAFTEANNLDRSQITEVNVSTAELPLLIADEVDITGALLTNEVVTLLADGYELNMIDYDDYGVSSYGQVLLSSDDYIAENPDLAQRFVAATLRSWEYTMEHVDEAIAALAEAVPETDVELETAKWPPIIELAMAPDGQTPFGQQSLEGWTQTAEAFEIGGLIDAPVDPATLFTNEFLPEDRLPDAAATPAA
jgi:NitT/TauT family transport system substrate-binding protein